uniref:Cysteine-rich venom protein n=1 Tax=Strigamia maritima TaxID=126957 RepID=T1IJR0_STRMM
MAVAINCVGMILLVLLKSILACDYTEFGIDHTMCTYPTTTCPILRSGFSEVQKNEILRAHNELRQKVANGKQNGQPRASNIRELSWNEELAKVAQKWADQCVSGHDHNRRTKIFTYVGQNVYTFWSTSSAAKPNVKDAVTSWYDEVERPGFDSSHIDPFQFSHPAGHYTQLVWAETKAVGCGYVFFNQYNMYTHHIVCNYGPGGNIVGGQMYKVGVPCRKCANGCSEKYPGLCGSGASRTTYQSKNKTTEDVTTDYIKDDSKSDVSKGDLKITADLDKPVDLLTKFFDMFQQPKEIYVQVPGMSNYKENKRHAIDYIIYTAGAKCLQWMRKSRQNENKVLLPHSDSNDNSCDVVLLRKQLAQQLVKIKNMLDESLSKGKPPTLRTLNAIQRTLEQVEPVFTIPRHQTTPDICPEVFTNQSIWIRPCKDASLDNLLTVLLYPSPSDDRNCSTSRIVSALQQYYPTVNVVIAIRFPECDVSNTHHQNLRKINFGVHKSDGQVLNFLISRHVNTPYTLIGRKIDNLNQFAHFERQISVFSMDPRVKVVGGATRNTSGHWKVGCYQSEMNNYVLEYKEGYQSSKNECMFCDYISSPFMAKTDFLKEITFDENLPNQVLFQDFFIRVRNTGAFVLNCPDVMHFSSPSESSLRDYWIPIALKWQLNYVVIPRLPRLKFSCSEIGISCVSSDKLTKTHLMPRCCIDDYMNGFRVLQKMAEEQNFMLELDSGTVMGAVKMRGVLPWDVDGDTVCLSSQFNIIKGLKSVLKENGFRLQIMEDARYISKEFRWSGGYMMLWTPEQSIEMYAMDYLSNRLLPPEFQNVTTKAEMKGVWMYAPASPGLFIRNRYGTECLQHAHHWRQNGKNSSWIQYEPGVFNSCPKRGHHACVDRFPADGNLQFNIQIQ